jgi:hypothetical protein
LFLIEEEHVLRVRDLELHKLSGGWIGGGTLLDSLLLNFSDSIEFTAMVLLLRAKFS